MIKFKEKTKEKGKKLKLNLIKINNKTIKNKIINSQSDAGEGLTSVQRIFDQGITLIALVITIIVMLILAGVTINLTLGDNGIFSKAKEARNKYEDARQNESNEIEKMTNLINNNGTYKKLTAEQFAFTSKNTNWNVENIKEALDYLYNN